MTTGRGGAALLGAAMALAVVVASGAVRTARTAVPARPGPAVVQSAAGQEAVRLLRGVAGTPPVACELITHALDNRWGSGGVQPRVRAPLGATDEERDLARWAWTGRPDAENAPALIEGLASDDACVRRVAASLLAHVTDAAVRTRVRERVDHGVGVERLAAMTALAGRHDDAAETSVRALLTAPDVTGRRAAAWALGAMEASGSLDALTAALRDGDAGVRINAAWALGTIEDVSAIPALTALLGSDGDADVRIAAAWALGRLD